MKPKKHISPTDPTNNSEPFPNSVLVDGSYYTGTYSNPRHRQLRDLFQKDERQNRGRKDDEDN